MAAKNIPEEKDEDSNIRYVNKLNAYKDQYDIIINHEKINVLFADLTDKLSKIISKESIRVETVNKFAEKLDKTSSYISQLISKKRLNFD